jgi:site-specific DNA recombinase
MSTKSRAVEFFRVSTKRQKDEGFSLDAQSSLAQKYYKKEKLKPVETWAVSESASKEKDRNKFYEMIEYVKEHEIKNIVFDKIDRACRGYKAAYLVEELMDEYDVKFHFTRDQLIIDKHSPMSVKDRFGIGVWMGKRYTDNLKLEVKKGMRERESRGYWNYKAPVGYINVRRNGRAYVELDKETHPFIKQVFEMYLTGNYSQEELTEYLKSKVTSRTIGKSLVERIISNPFYYGDMLVKGNVISGNHEPLISKNLWDDCQRIRGIRAIGQDKSDKVLVKKPLMGLLRCEECHSKITGEVKRKPSGKQYIYYHCANVKCNQRRKNIRQEVILEQIIKAFEPLSEFSHDKTQELIEKLKTNAVDLDIQCQEKLNGLKEKQERITQKLEKLEVLKDSGILDASEYQNLVANNKNILDKCKNEISDYLSSENSVFGKGLKVIELLQKSYDFMRLSDDLRAKARIAKIVLSNPILKDGSIGFSYENPFDNLIKNLTFEKWWT